MKSAVTTFILYSRYQNLGSHFIIASLDFLTIKCIEMVKPPYVMCATFPHIRFPNLCVSVCFKRKKKVANLIIINDTMSYVVLLFIWEKLLTSLCVRDKAEDLYWMPVVLRLLRRHCITHQHDCVNEITKWAQEYFQRPQSDNIIYRTICRCQLKLHLAKRKLYLNMVQKSCCVLWAETCLKLTFLKLENVLWSDESKCEQFV